MTHPRGPYLAPSRRKALDFIRQHVERTSRFPSTTAIGDAIGLHTHNGGTGVHDVLLDLICKGFVKRERRRGSRGYSYELTREGANDDT